MQKTYRRCRLDVLAYISKALRNLSARFQKTKRDFLKSSNSIFGKIGRSASEEVLIELIISNCIYRVVSKCLPILLYGTDVCSMNSADRHSLQFTINRIVYTIFGAVSKDIY